MRRGFYPSTRFRAALPGITGSKRENPLRHQCSQHLAVRSRAGRSMPRTARTRVTSPPPGTAPAPSISCHRSTSLRWAGWRACNYNGDVCQDLVSTSETKTFGLMSLHAPSPVAPCRRCGRRRRTGRRIHVAGPAIAAGYARLALLRRAVLAIPINVIAKSHDAPRRVPRRCPACRKIKAHRHRDGDNSDQQSQNGFHHENLSVFAPRRSSFGN